VYKQLIQRNEFAFFLFSYFCSFVFVIVSYYHTLYFDIKGDTAEYFFFFNNILKNPFPYGLEFVTSCIMWLVFYIGGDFRFFLFVCLLIWTPVVFLILHRAKNNIFLFLVFLFFLSPLFLNNALFLIRQFNAALFLFLYLYCLNINKSSRFFLLVLMFLSICSHISAIMWFVFINKIVVNFFSRPIYILLTLILSFLTFLFNVDSLLILVNILIDLSSILGVDEFDRKLLFYTSGESLKAVSVSYKLLFPCLFISLFSAYQLIMNVSTYKGLYFLIFIQSIFLIVLSNNVVAASRFGFVAYYFVVPLFLFFLSTFFKRIRVLF